MNPEQYLNNSSSLESIRLLLNEEFTPYEIHRVTLTVTISEEIINLIKPLGIDISHFEHELDNYGIKHSLDRHGKDSLPVTKDDFYKIPEILSSPDQVTYVGTSGIGTHLIEYRKAFNGTTYYLEEIRTGRKTLSLKTLYKKETL
jgi:hypothetical protein